MYGDKYGEFVCGYGGLKGSRDVYAEYGFTLWVIDLLSWFWSCLLGGEGRRGGCQQAGSSCSGY